MRSGQSTLGIEPADLARLKVAANAFIRRAGEVTDDDDDDLLGIDLW